METKNKKELPKYVNREKRVAVWENLDKKGKKYLTLVIEGNLIHEDTYVNLFKPKASDALRSK